MKNPPSVQETQVQSWVGIPFLDLLEKEMATTSVFLPRKSHGQRSLSGSSPWGQQRVEHCLATDHAHLFIFSEKKKKSLLKPWALQKSACTILHSHQQYISNLVFKCSPKFSDVIICYFTHPNRCVMSHHTFNFHFHNELMMWNIFSHVNGHLYINLVTIMFIYFVHLYIVYFMLNLGIFIYSRY